jgi:3-oxoacyl-[acyl-carrier protein] reductase
MQAERVPTALVTNASDFVGPPAVDALLGDNFRVLVGDKTFSDADAWARFSAQHPGVELIPAREPAILITTAWEMAGRIDVLISNDHHPAVREQSAAVAIDELRRTLEVLVVEPFSLVQAAIPRFKAQAGGNIVMITSCRTRLPIPGGAVPDAARAAANALVRSLAAELAPFEISVNAIAPNYLYSEAYYPRAKFIDNQAGREFVETIVPARRLGRPEEIGEVIRFLATTNARFLTGAIIDFAGGWPASPIFAG